MRRLVLLLVLSLVGASFAGRLVGATGVDVNGSTISSSQIRHELAVIAHSPAYGCYLKALVKMDHQGSSLSFNAKGSASWTHLQVEGLTVVDYVEHRYHWRATPSVLRHARGVYESELTAASSTCATSSSAVLAKLPSWFLTDQLTQNAASQVFQDHLTGIVPLTDAGLTSYFTAHRSYYDDICISIAEIQPQSLTAFAKGQAAGESVAELAKKYSIDSSSTSGGAYGCYKPNSSAYAVVRAYTYGNKLNTFPVQPREIATETGYVLLYVAATSRSASTFINSASLVLSDVQTYNDEIASVHEGALVSGELVRVDPAFGRWIPATGTVRTLLVPPAATVPNSGAGLVL